MKTKFHWAIMQKAGIVLGFRSWLKIYLNLAKQSNYGYYCSLQQ